ncbi:MAG: replicative DNA helicase [Myxococcota bacterium]
MSDPEHNSSAGTVPVGEVLKTVDHHLQEVLQKAADAALRAPKDHLHAHDAERGVLCAILLDGDKYEEAVLEGLQPQDFHHPAHTVIFQAMGRLHQNHQPIDFVTLTEQLTRDGKLDAAGGTALIGQLEALLPTTEHASAYIKLVQDKALLRQLVDVSRQTVQWAFRPGGDADSVIDRAERSILSIRRESARKGITHVHELAVQAMKHYELLHKGKKPVIGISSGFLDFDQLTCGLQPGELVVIAARPSMGKTAFTLNVAAHVAAQQKIPTAFFSLEMSGEQLFHRLIGAQAKLDLGHLRRGHIRQDEYAKLAATAATLDKTALYIDETPALSIAALRSKARYLVQHNSVQLLIVDYLQLMHSTTSYDNKATEVGEISKGLKTLARELKIPVIALSQLNRSVESRTDKRPMMSDLRESGAIEQDADVIAFLYREEYYLRDRTPDALLGIAEVIIAKNRNGPTGAFKLRFASNITLFENLAETEPPFAANPPANVDMARDSRDAINRVSTTNGDQDARDTTQTPSDPSFIEPDEPIHET